MEVLFNDTNTLNVHGENVLIVSILLTNCIRTGIFVASGLFSQGDEVSCRSTFCAIIHSIGNLWPVKRTNFNALELKELFKIESVF